MSKIATFLAKGEVIAYTNPSSVAEIPGGDIVALGGCVGVAVANIAASGVGSLQIDGVFSVPAVNNAAFAVGDPLFWDASEKKVTKIHVADEGDAYIGIAYATKTETAATAAVKINVGFPGPFPVGIPQGGTTGQVLKKKSDANFDVEWAVDAT